MARLAAVEATEFGEGGTLPRDREDSRLTTLLETQVVAPPGNDALATLERLPDLRRRVLKLRFKFVLNDAFDLFASEARSGGQEGVVAGAWIDSRGHRDSLCLPNVLSLDHPDQFRNAKSAFQTHARQGTCNFLERGFERGLSGIGHGNDLRKQERRPGRKTPGPERFERGWLAMGCRVCSKAPIS